MSRLQLAVLAGCSLLATVVVLAAGSATVDAPTAIPARVASTVALPAAPAAAEPVASADETSEPADAEPAAGAEAADEPAAEPAASEEEAPAESTEEPAAPAAEDDKPRATHVKHVFVVALSARGPGTPYLDAELTPKGALFSRYTSLGSDLADRLALIGGQPPNADTLAGCTVYKEISQDVKPSKAGEIAGPGCVYPSSVVTVADQVTASGRAWRAYVQDLDKGPTATKSCRRPVSNTPDDTQAGRPGDGYATRLNPFVYFHSLLDLGDCDASDGPLERLEADLRGAKTTPAYSFIAPNLCNAGAESPCADGSPGGAAAADAFLAAWVPKILASPAYQEGGLLIVTLGDRALLLSRFVTAGTTFDDASDSYVLLRATQDALSLRPLARAAKAPSLLDTVLAGARVAQPGDD